MLSLSGGDHPPSPARASPRATFDNSIPPSRPIRPRPLPRQATRGSAKSYNLYKTYPGPFRILISALGILNSAFALSPPTHKAAQILQIVQNPRNPRPGNGLQPPPPESGTCTNRTFCTKRTPPSALIYLFSISRAFSAWSACSVPPLFDRPQRPQLQFRLRTEGRRTGTEVPKHAAAGVNQAVWRV